MSLAVFTTAAYLLGAASLGAVLWVRDLSGGHSAELWLVGPSNNVAERHTFDLQAGESVVEYQDMAVDLEGTTSYVHPETNRRIWLVDTDHGAAFHLPPADEDNAPLLHRMDGFHFFQARENQRLLEFEQAAGADLQSFMDQVPYLLKLLIAGVLLALGMLVAGFGWVGGG